MWSSARPTSCATVECFFSCVLQPETARHARCKATNKPNPIFIHSPTGLHGYPALHSSKKLALNLLLSQRRLKLIGVKAILHVVTLNDQIRHPSLRVQCLQLRRAIAVLIDFTNLRFETILPHPTFGL